MSPKARFDELPEQVNQPGHSEHAMRTRYVSQPAQGGSSGLGVGCVTLLLAALFIFGPIALKMSVYPDLNVLTMTVIMLFGMLLFLAGGGTTIYTRYYHRAPADKAFVRTGAGGPKVIVNGGALVIPGFHQVIWVSLRTLKLEVTRSGPDALIT